MIADCLNGCAFDTREYRSYRAGYGKITPDTYNKAAGVFGVEVEQENGWEGLPPVSANGGAGYWLSTVTEQQYEGTPVATTLINVKNAVVHPPKEGMTVPNVDSTPRRIRVTGGFRAEIPGITNCLQQFEYLFQRYFILP